MTTNLTTEQFDALVSELYAGPTVEFEIRTDYSGRGMYGKECVGFVTPDPVRFAMALAIVLERFDQDSIENDTTNVYPYWDDLKVATDSMAFETIVYFPTLTVGD